MLEQRIEADLKTAMLARETGRVDALRMVKSVLLNAKVAEGKRDTGLSDAEVITLLAKEAKKRQESADLYVQGGNQARADGELAEKALIEQYLPAQLSEAELGQIVDQVMSELQPAGLSAMGQVIGAVKAKVGASADGAVIARLVKEKLPA
jgi:uncharacterized protein YqeY